MYIIKISCVIYSSHLYDLATATDEDDDEVLISDVVFEELSREVDGSISSLCASNLIK